MLAVSLALCLPHFAHGEGAADAAAARNMAEMQFGSIPGLPTCFSGAVESGDPSKGAAFILAKLATGCTVPWHWHTAGENVLVVSGTGQMSMKGSKPKTLHSGGFAQLPSHHIHQFHCVKKCTLLIAASGAFDIHYVDAKETEIPADEAMKAVKEKAAAAM
jgi:quercetin dioxygenase-like cupin family protein